MKHCFILWTRPEIIKLYSCIKHCQKQKLDYFIIHTNQHYSENMDKIFFEELSLPQPRYNLNINGGWHWSMTGRMMISIEKVLLNEKPNIVYVQWDTNTVLAGWLVATKLGIKVVHIEAGLRSYDRNMPEETNRVCIDHLANYLFAPTHKQQEILLQEWIDASKIWVVGNTIVDAVYQVSDLVQDKTDDVLQKYWIEKNTYILLTTHRPSNVDQKTTLAVLLSEMKKLWQVSGKKILFPIHPRTKNNIYKFWLDNYLSYFILIEPVWFLENIVLESNSYMIATDSWWIQEEACILQKKTLILRNNTERPETLEVGGAILCGNNKILHWYHALKDKKINWYNPFGDGRAAENIITTITQW